MPRRYLVGEHWVNGKLNAVWTSEVPGVTGPPDFEVTHQDEAVGQMPVRDGWRYYWHTDSLSVDAVERWVRRWLA